jgi:hypothetical protein
LRLERLRELVQAPDGHLLVAAWNSAVAKRLLRTTQNAEYFYSTR